MAKTASTMLPLGTPAQDFRLPDTSGKLVSLADFPDAPALLVIFMGRATGNSERLGDSKWRTHCCATWFPVSAFGGGAKASASEPSGAAEGGHGGGDWFRIRLGPSFSHD